MTQVISCPVCRHGMKEICRDDVMIDICTFCRGIWLDKGELEELIAHSVRTAIFGIDGQYADVSSNCNEVRNALSGASSARDGISRPSVIEK